MSNRPSTKLLLPLQIIAALSVVGPLVLLAYASWANFRAIDRRASERIESALDVTQEFSLKILQTIERAIAESNEVLRDLSDDEIRSQERRLSARLAQIGGTLSEAEAIWAFDRTGAPLVSSTIFPVPPRLNNADRDYFQAQLKPEAGTFIGDIVQARVGSSRFFVISRRRPNNPDGSFNGVIGVTVMPERIREFYQRLSQGVADFFGLIREDGLFLARFPTVQDRPERVDAQSGFATAIRSAPLYGTYTSVAQIDGVERRVGYRRLPNYPLYVLAGIETKGIWRELWDTMVAHLFFGIPATLAMLALAVAALRGTARFQVEVARREQAETALKQAQRLEAVGQLTGGVAHDFNNLLMVVRGNVDRLRRYAEVDDRQRRLLDAVDTAAKRGASLTRQLLSFSRRQTLNAAPVDIGEHLAAQHEMLQTSLRGDMLLHVEVADGLWPVKVDVSEFDLALLNIAVNARDAMPQGGSLTVDCRNVVLSEAQPPGLGGEFVAIRIADTGTGIAEATLKRVFEPFFTTKEQGKGTGLGLSQVYGFARQSGGDATIESEVGRGTAITLYLPRTREPVLPQGEAARSPDAADRERGRVLLVDDNPDIAEVTSAHLEELGYEVTLAANAADAMAKLDEAGARYSLVLTDIVMPGATGIDLARAIRAKFGQRIPVLLATGFSKVDVADEEGLPVLRKPYDLKDLRAGIGKALRAARNG